MIGGKHSQQGGDHPGKVASRVVALDLGNGAGGERSDGLGEHSYHRGARPSVDEWIHGPEPEARRRRARQRDRLTDDCNAP